MRLLLAASFLCSVASAQARMVDLNALHAQCLPEAPVSTLRALIQVESGGNPNAIQIDFPHSLLKRWNLPPGTLRLNRQPQDNQQARDWLAYFESLHISVDLGLMQVSTAEAQRRGIPPASLLEPCTNLRAGWQVLQEDYNVEVKVYGSGQAALTHAISRYNTGNSESGIDNGYIARVLTAARMLSDTPAQSGRHQR